MARVIIVCNDSMHQSKSIVSPVDEGKNERKNNERRNQLVCPFQLQAVGKPLVAALPPPKRRRALKI